MLSVLMKCPSREKREIRSAQSVLHFTPWQTCSFQLHLNFSGKRSATLQVLHEEYSLTYRFCVHYTTLQKKKLFVPSSLGTKPLNQLKYFINLKLTVLHNGVSKHLVLLLVLCCHLLTALLTCEIGHIKYCHLATSNV